MGNITLKTGYVLLYTEIALDIIDSIAFIFMKWSQGQKMCLQFIYILSRGTFKHVICKKDG